MPGEGPLAGLPLAHQARLLGAVAALVGRAVGREALEAADEEIAHDDCAIGRALPDIGDGRLGPARAVARPARRQQVLRAVAAAARAREQVLDGAVARPRLPRAPDAAPTVALPDLIDTSHNRFLRQGYPPTMAPPGASTTP